MKGLGRSGTATFTQQPVHRDSTATPQIAKTWRSLGTARRRSHNSRGADEDYMTGTGDGRRGAGVNFDPAIQRSLRSNIAHLQKEGLAIVRAIRSQAGPRHTAQQHRQRLSQLKKAQVILLV